MCKKKNLKKSPRRFLLHHRALGVRWHRQNKQQKRKKKKLKESKSMAAQQRDSTSTTRKPAVRPQLYEICRVLRCLPLPKDTFVIATSNFPNNNSKPLYTLWKFLKERKKDRKKAACSFCSCRCFLFFFLLLHVLDSFSVP